MRELMIEAEYAPFAPDWFLEAASRWFTVQKTPCLQTAEAVIGEPTLEALQNAPQLRWLQMTWAGADRYLHGGFPRGVLLTTASGAFGETIAEHAIGMLLALCRRLLRGRGAARVHGGGFAGTALCMVPEADYPAFRAELEALLAPDCCHRLQIV